MAGINETREWTEQVYQLEQTDAVLGGPEGPSNLPHRHLANRTRWLRDKILSATQSLTIHDDDGTPHEMVWIPRFRVPAGFLYEGFPPQDLRLGGFLVDKYRASAIEYPGGAQKAVSQLARVGKVMVSWLAARTMAARRVIHGRPCHVLTAREWGTLAWLNLILGHPLRGALVQGRDTRDPDQWEYYAEPGMETQYNVGTGPLSWAHQGLPSGVMDLVGYIQHMIDHDGLAAGVLTVVHRAKLVNAISANDPSFEIEDPAGYYAPWLGFENWPNSNGLVLLDQGTTRAEFVVYGQLVPVQGSPHRATLTECSRGQYGTGPDTHPAGASCENQVLHCIVPDGYTAEVDGDGLLNTNPGEVTFNWKWGIYQHGTHDTAPSAGDLIACETEDLAVTAVNGNSITATRGVNGTPITGHPSGTPFTSYSPTMIRVEQGAQVGTISGYRDHPDLVSLLIPRTQANLDDPLLQIYMLGVSPPFIRGKPSMDALLLPHHTMVPSAYAGFRCAWTPSDYQYGGQL